MKAIETNWIQPKELPMMTSQKNEPPLIAGEDPENTAFLAFVVVTCIVAATVVVVSSVAWAVLAR